MNDMPAGVPAGSKDRYAGLIGFGILVILIGCLCGLMVPLMLFGQRMAAPAAPAASGYGTLMPAVLMYGGMAVAFVWLGIGSIMARRWARALLLILSWGWLLTGLIIMATMAMLLPQILKTPGPGGQAMPDSTHTAFFIGFMIVQGVIFLVLPGVLALFYGGRNVKATCEARDPVQRWTDACPLPVLALSLMLGFGVLSMLPMLLTYKSVAPVFGVLVTGAPATALFWGMTALMGYCAWAIYRLNPSGWWLVLIFWGLAAVSSAITFSRVDLMEVYRQMGYPEEQMAQLERFSAFSSRYMVWMMAGFAVPFLGYLLFVKRYFRRPAAS